MMVAATGWWSSAARFVDAGGVVMWPLLGAGFLLWYFIALRWLHLSREESTERAARELRGLGSARRGAGEVEVTIGAHRASLDAHAKVIKTLVASAPLLGLLGTVSGMIETFDSIRYMEVISESGGISGGISQALTTTQMGLGLAIPGLLVARALDRKAERRRRELGELEREALARLGGDGGGGPERGEAG
jgi:biopolymer transport protein ExbB